MQERDIKTPERSSLVYKTESYAIMGACFEVYKEKGCGFLEPVYQECLELEFALQHISARPQVKILLDYKGHELAQSYEPDFLCYVKIIVEIKALTELTDRHRAKAHNYLKATGMKLALLVNFGHYPGIEYERIVR